MSLGSKKILVKELRNRNTHKSNRNNRSNWWMEVSEAKPLKRDRTRRPSTTSGERICPLESGKAREVTVRCTKRGAVFQRNRGDDGVHDERAGGLALAHQAAQDLPVPLTRFEDTPTAGWASQDETTASASDVESGCSNTRGFVPMRRKAHSVSQAKRTILGPERASSSHARLSWCCSALS
jgi:hypothetical protein